MTNEGEAYGTHAETPVMDSSTCNNKARLFSFNTMKNTQTSTSVCHDKIQYMYVADPTHCRGWTKTPL